MTPRHVRRGRQPESLVTSPVLGATGYAYAHLVTSATPAGWTGSGRAPKAPRPRRGHRFWRLPAAVVGAVLLGVNGGLAFAYLTGTGSGTGYATVALVKDGAVAKGVVSPSLVPGKTGTLYLTVTNPNKFEVELTTLTIVKITSATPGKCASTYLVPNTFPSTYPLPAATVITVPAETGSTPGSVTATVSTVVALEADAPTTCQGVAFTVTLTLSGKTL